MVHWGIEEMAIIAPSVVEGVGENAEGGSGEEDLCIGQHGCSTGRHLWIGSTRPEIERSPPPTLNLPSDNPLDDSLPSSDL